MKLVPWRGIEPLSESGRPRDSRFAALDSLRDEWRAQMQALSSEEFTRRRKRTLRKQAVDTGLIGRLYDLDRDQTRALVAEGFARDAMARTNGASEVVLATIQAQLQALEEIGPEVISGQRQITTSLIRELHAAITQTQASYIGQDATGVEREIPLNRGAWRDQPSTIAVGDQRFREACPPEHIQAEIERLLDWWNSLDAEHGVHALVKIAWFHHRFVQIHPFADGNGRVARGLASLLMQKHGLPPLVIDAEKREAYFDALERADIVTLSPLSSFFMDVSNASMLQELEARETDDHANAVTIARSVVLAIAARKAAEREAIALNARTFDQLRGFMETVVLPWFRSTSEALQRALEHPDSRSSVELTFHAPIIDQPLPDPWIQTHIEAAAQVAKQAYEVRSCVGAIKLKIQVEDDWVIFGAASYRLSPASNIMVLIPFSSSLNYTERFWFSAHDPSDELNERRPELAALLEFALSQAMLVFKRRLLPNPV